MSLINQGQVAHSKKKKKKTTHMKYFNRRGSVALYKLQKYQKGRKREM